MMNKTAVIAHLAASSGTTTKQVSVMLEDLVALATIEAKNTFLLPGFGKLVLQDRAARMGRNPATGEKIQIAAKKVVKFKIAKGLKDAVLGS